MNIFDYYYYRTYSHPEIWESYFNTIPEGYELKEKPEHRKKRLEQEKEIHEKNIETLKKQLTISQEKLEAVKKELED